MTFTNFIKALLQTLWQISIRSIEFIAIALCLFFFALGFITFVLCKDEIKSIIKAYFKGFRKEVLNPIKKQIKESEKKNNYDSKRNV